MSNSVGVGHERKFRKLFVVAKPKFDLTQIGFVVIDPCVTRLCVSAALATFGIAIMSAVADDRQTCERPRDEEAIAACSRLLDLDRGNAYLAKADYDRAIADLDRAIKLDPKFALPYYARGSAYLSKGDYDLSRPLISRRSCAIKESKRRTNFPKRIGDHQSDRNKSINAGKILNPDQKIRSLPRSHGGGHRWLFARGRGSLNTPRSSLIACLSTICMRNAFTPWRTRRWA
jgi:hypothetical protein